MEIAGSTVVVTGAASGIGFAIAEACAAAGGRLVLADIEQRALDRAVAALRERGAEATAIRTDVRRIDDLELLRDEVDRIYGGATVLCNNAGVMPAGAPVWETPMADLEWTVDVNLWGIVRGIRAFVPGMIERGVRAHVVNTASMAALGSAPTYAGYAMSKAAVVSLTGSLRDELQAAGAPIGVSVVLPEMIRTRLAFAERNRGADTADMPEDSSSDVFRVGLDPAVIGARVADAIARDRFWVMPPADDPFVIAAHAWMKEIVESSL